MPCLHLSPPQKSNPGPDGREGGGAQLREPCLGMVWPLHRLTLPGKSCFMVPAMAAPACFVLSARDKLLLAPARLFANVNLPQPLLLISQSCWIPLGAVTPGGKVPCPSGRSGLRQELCAHPQSLLSGSPFLHPELCCILILSSASFFLLPSSTPVANWGEWCCWQSSFRLC